MMISSECVKDMNGHLPYESSLLEHQVFRNRDDFLEYIIQKYSSYDYIAVLRYYKDESKNNLISGGAKGVDKMAEEWATKNGLSITIFRPNWDKYGKGAGPRRNVQIIGAATHCIAFPSKMGKGTQDSIGKAKRKGIPLKVIYID